MYLEKKKKHVTIPSFVFPVFCWIYYCCGVSYWRLSLSLCCSVGAVSVISPLELVRTKMQSRKQPYSELMMCIRSAVAQDGWLSLWRGWGPTVLRDVPFSGQWTVHSLAAWRWTDVPQMQCLTVFVFSPQPCTGLTMSLWRHSCVSGTGLHRPHSPSVLQQAPSQEPWVYSQKPDMIVDFYFKWPFKIRNSMAVN